MLREKKRSLTFGVCAKAPFNTIIKTNANRIGLFS